MSNHVQARHVWETTAMDLSKTGSQDIPTTTPKAMMTSLQHSSYVEQGYWNPMHHYAIVRQVFLQKNVLDKWRRKSCSGRFKQCLTSLQTRFLKILPVPRRSRIPWKSQLRLFGVWWICVVILSPRFGRLWVPGCPQSCLEEESA